MSRRGGAVCSRRGAPWEIVIGLSSETAAAPVDLEHLRNGSTAAGLGVVANAPDEVAALLKVDIAKWTPSGRTSEMSLM